jgi:hypothetical protein
MNTLSEVELKALLGSLFIQKEYAEAEQAELTQKLLTKLGLNKLEQTHWKSFIMGLDFAIDDIIRVLQLTEQEIEEIKAAKK